MKGHSGATELFTFLVVVVVKHCVHLLKRKKQLCSRKGYLYCL